MTTNNNEQAITNVETTSAPAETHVTFADSISTSPLIDNALYERLPAFLQEGSRVFQSHREKDVFLTGAITILSGCFPMVHGVYNGSDIYSNLFSFVVAPPASGKGSFAFAKKLGQVRQRNLLAKSRLERETYELNLKLALASKNKSTVLPTEPKFNALFIPADSSSASVVNVLLDNGGNGIMCETEADTMTKNFEQDWGGYSDLLRKSFHHDPVTRSRMTNREYLEIENPKLSVALTGTPDQVGSLINSSDNGLFSRFIFYIFSNQEPWYDVSTRSRINFSEHFQVLSEKVNNWIESMNERNILFDLTPEQWDTLNKTCDKLLRTVYGLYPEELVASIKRAGLIIYRLAMILSMVRNLENDSVEDLMVCQDVDFELGLSLGRTYLNHAFIMLKLLPSKTKDVVKPEIKRLYSKLPNEFQRMEAVEIGKGLSLCERTVDGYLKKMNGNLLEVIKAGTYKKL